MQFLSVVPIQRLIPERVLVKNGIRVLRVIGFVAFRDWRIARGSSRGEGPFSPHAAEGSSRGPGLLILIFVGVNRVDVLILCGIIIILDMIRHGFNDASSVAWHGIDFTVMNSGARN